MSDSSTAPRSPENVAREKIQKNNSNANGNQKGHKKYLLLVDMNGTLCHRLGNGKVVGRPGHDDFIANMVENKNFDFCMYTSMLFKNADQALRRLAPKYHHDIEMFDSTYNKSDPNPKKENDWDTIRDLPKVWAKKPGYGDKCTILVDCEFRKLRETPDNGIIVPEFVSHENPDCNVLERLENYLRDLGTAQPEDVSTYLRTHPFRVHKDSDKSAWRSASFWGNLTMSATQTPVLPDEAAEITPLVLKSDYACPPAVKKRAVGDEVYPWAVGTVPKGTMVELMHIEGLKITMRDLEENFKISFIAHQKLGILRRIMDYHDVLSSVGETRIDFECVERLD